MTENKNLYSLHYVLKYKINMVFRANADIFTKKKKMQQAWGENKLAFGERKL